jgi:hypothetical protein
MASIGGILAKCAALAAIPVGLLAMSEFSERKTLTSWAPAAMQERAKAVQNVAASKPAEPAAVAAKPEPPPAAADQRCADQVWPNISKECITGRVEPARKEARAVAGPEPRLTPILPVTAGASARSSTVTDPPTTGALPVVAAAPAPAHSSVEPAVQATPRAPRPRQAQRPRRQTVAAQRAAPAGPERIREPIQFRLAEGRN